MPLVSLRPKTLVDSLRTRVPRWTSGAQVWKIVRVFHTTTIEGLRDSPRVGSDTIASKNNPLDKPTLLPCHPRQACPPGLSAAARPLPLPPVPSSFW